MERMGSRLLGNACDGRGEDLLERHTLPLHQLVRGSRRIELVCEPESATETLYLGADDRP